MPKKLKTVSLLTKRNELSAKSIVKLFKAFKLILFCLKKVEKKLKRVLLLNWLQTLLNFYFLNRLQNFLKYFTCPFFWSKKRRRYWKWLSCLPNERKYLLNGLQNFLKDSISYYFVLKSTKEIYNSSAHSDYLTNKIICSIDCKTFKRISSFFFSKKWKEIENSSAVYETKWIMCSMDFKTSLRILTLTILF